MGMEGSTIIHLTAKVLIVKNPYVHMYLHKLDPKGIDMFKFECLHFQATVST